MSGVIIAQGIWQFIITENYVTLNIPDPKMINIIFVSIMAIIFGFLAFKLVDIVLKLVTAFVGAFCVSSGIAFLVIKYVKKQDKNLISMMEFFCHSNSCDTFK